MTAKKQLIYDSVIYYIEMLICNMTIFTKKTIFKIVLNLALITVGVCAILDYVLISFSLLYLIIVVIVNNTHLLIKEAQNVNVNEDKSKVNDFVMEVLQYAANKSLLCSIRGDVDNEQSLYMFDEKTSADILICKCPMIIGDKDAIYYSSLKSITNKIDEIVNASIIN